MLATPEDIAAIQGMRLKNSEKNKMTRDHNGFRKLLIVLTRAGKLLALHTGEGRVVWSLLLHSLRGSEGCQFPTALNVYQWQVPHHHAMDANPSILVVGRCGLTSDAPAVLSFVDAYTGKELNSLRLPHSVAQVVPLPFTDSKEQRLHLLIDTEKHAHLFPRSPDSIKLFLHELPNIYWYHIDQERDIIKGHTLHANCDLDEADGYCFNTRELWSVVFPSESEKIAMTATRKLNEVSPSVPCPLRLLHFVCMAMLLSFKRKNMAFSSDYFPVSFQYACCCYFLSDKVRDLLSIGVL